MSQILLFLIIYIDVLLSIYDFVYAIKLFKYIIEKCYIIW